MIFSDARITRLAETMAIKLGVILTMRDATSAPGDSGPPSPQRPMNSPKSSKWAALHGRVRCQRRSAKNIVLRSGVWAEKPIPNLQFRNLFVARFDKIMLAKTTDFSTDFFCQFEVMVDNEAYVAEVRDGKILCATYPKPSSE